MPAMAGKTLTMVAERIRRERERCEASRLRIRQELDSVLSELGPRHGIRRGVLYGSLAWGGFHDRSDVDLVVWGAEPGDEDALAGEILQRVGRPAHVVRAEWAPPGLVERVLAEGEELRVH
jgi:predicted nucleotidyltransferase